MLTQCDNNIQQIITVFVNECVAVAVIKLIFSYALVGVLSDINRCVSQLVVGNVSLLLAC